jgi:hypothetical protein
MLRFGHRGVKLQKCTLTPYIGVFGMLFIPGLILNINILDDHMLTKLPCASYICLSDVFLVIKPFEIALKEEFYDC